MNLSFEEISRDSDFYNEALKIRYDLFFREYNLPWEILFDDDELESHHFVLISDGELISYGRLTENKYVVKFSQMVVKPEFQSKGFGSILLEKMKKYCEQFEVKDIRLSAIITAIDFYSKSGYKIVGKIYKSKKTQVEHIEMVKQI